MDILFLDANILFSAAYNKNSALKIFWELQAKLMSSDYAENEAERNLFLDEQKLRLVHLMKSVELITNYPLDNIPANITLRKKDMPILAAAIAANASHLITGDYRDFGKLFFKKIKTVTVLPPVEYLKKVS
ncbi:MAG: hypothetical protein WC756_10535 [Taibaiella sp.]|jgi:predicted nucleic acid-binding protein